MNDTQKEIFEKVDELLKEHFDAHVLVVQVEDVNDDCDISINASWGGGTAVAIGLHELQVAKLKDRYVRTNRISEE